MSTQRKFVAALSIAAATLFAFSTLAAAAGQGSVAIADAWVRASVPHQKATGVFMRLSAQKDLRFVSASSPAAGAVEIHEMTMENNIMRMRAVNGIDLPTAKTVELKPGGYHLMLLDLKQQIKEGDMVPVTLTIEDKDRKRETIQLKVLAQPLGFSPGQPGHAFNDMQQIRKNTPTSGESR